MRPRQRAEPSVGRGEVRGFGARLEVAVCCCQSVVALVCVARRCACCEPKRRESDGVRTVSKHTRAGVIDQLIPGCIRGGARGQERRAEHNSAERIQAPHELPAQCLCSAVDCRHALLWQSPARAPHSTTPAPALLHLQPLTLLSAFRLRPLLQPLPTMTAPAAKSAFPPPPPFFELYSFPPPPAPLSDEQLADARVVAARAKADALRSAAASSLPVDLYSPPPPLNEAFIKFGEVQPSGFMLHELGPEVPQLFVKTEAAASAAAASSVNTVAAASSTAATATPANASQLVGLPESAGVDFTASLRLLNRQYLQAYLNVLDTLTSAAPATASAPGSSPVASPDPGAHVERALKRLSDIGANLSWLLSALRPHQALQTVIQMSMRQIQKRKQKTEEVRRSERTRANTRGARRMCACAFSVCALPLTRSGCLSAAVFAQHHRRGSQLPCCTRRALRGGQHKH